jgi:hypothetical protein
MTQCSKRGTLAIVVAAALAVGSLAASAAVTKKGPFYKVEVTTTAKGDAITATVKAEGTNGYHPNKDYPWKLTLTPGTGVTAAKTVYTKADVQLSPTTAAFTVQYQATAGAKPVAAELKLSMCDAKQCQMEKVQLSWPAR